MASPVTALRDLMRRRTATAAAQQMTGGVIKIGGSSYSASWSFTRTLNSVYSNATGFRCVEHIANDFQRPEFEVRKPGQEETFESHPLLDVLNNPAPGMSGTSMQHAIARDISIAGKSCWFKMRGTDGFGDKGPTTGLRRLAPQRVTMIGNDDDELLGFIYSDRSSNRMPILPEDMLYLRYEHPEKAYDCIAPAIMAGLPAEIDNAAARFNYDLLANDGALPGYISVEDMTLDEFNTMKAYWESGEVPGKTRFLGGNATYIKVGQTNREMTYTDLRHDSEEDICRAFGVPQILLDPSDAKFANGEAAERVYMTKVILPLWIMVADQMTVQLGVDDQVEVGFDLDDIAELSEAEDAIVERGVLQIDRGMITINEWRAANGLEPVPWGEYPHFLSGTQFGTEADPIPPQVQPALGTGTVEPDDEQIARSTTEIVTRTVNATIKGIQGPTAGPKPWHDFDRRTTLYEQRAQRKMRKFFDRQGTVIAARVRAGKGKSYTKAMASWWDRTRWDNELEDEGKDFLGDAVDGFATETLAALPTDVAFDATNERAASWIASRSQKMAGLVNDTTEADVRAVIAQGEADGLGMDEIANLISGYFSDQADMRAERVARTEVISASNFGVLEGARQSGVATGKTFMCAADADEECSTYDGTTYDLDDDSVDIPQHVNCRCCWTIETDSGPVADDSGDSEE